METQKDLFNKPIKEDWKDEWKGMPEFVQEDKRPYKLILISFRNKEDLKTFSELIKQRITERTRSICFPKFDKEKPSNYLYTYIKEKE